MADPSSTQQCADVVGTANLLCLNAGVLSTWMGTPWEAPHEEWNRVLAVNLVGVVNGLRSFLPPMLASNDRRNVLIKASLAGAATWPGGGPYAASKHAVLALSEQVALELTDTNVGVTMICPALARTAMSDHGVDPVDVAVETLQAVKDRRFGVVPSEWSTTVTDRAPRLASGAQPVLPEPNQ